MDSYRVTEFGKALVLQSEPNPVPKGREVLIRTTGCGVCHSDVHLHEGSFDLGQGKKVDMGRAMGLPRTLGHEIVGEVVAVGNDVTAAEAKAGARYVVFPWIGCQACAICKSGDEHLCNQPKALGVNCDGGYATHVLVPDAKYLFDFDGLDEALACTYACSGLTAFGALKKARDALKGGGDLLILGAGGVGLSGVRMAEAVTGVKPIVADVDTAKWAAAKAAGAKDCIDPRDADAARALFKSTGGGVTAAIDFVGAAASFMFGFNALRKSGRLIVVGLFGGSAALPVPMIPLKNATVMGSYVGNLDDMRELMALAKSGKVPGLPIATRPLKDANEVLSRLAEGKIVGRVVLTP
ncbi:MAG: alcohol dehydrogenase catalytic domain-containing protein [Proteobacteria bacterium]|nr:alcohol dehydrogenase catalytic domain-containing protein [Pseudomonadota bacterium]